MLIYSFNIYRFNFWFIIIFFINYIFVYIPKHNIKKIYFLHKIAIFKKLINYSVNRVFLME
jgi:hypothetical protein